MPYNGPEAWEEFEEQSSSEEMEAVDQTPVVQNTSEEAQKALGKFYDVVDTRDLNPKQARLYEQKLYHLLMDHFLDKEDVERINEMVGEIEKKVDGWNKLVSRLDKTEGDLDYDTRQMIRSQCYDWKTGRINFRGSRKLESKVTLAHLFSGENISIKINEGRRSAKARGIPEDAVQENGYYLLERSGNDYFYIASGEKVRAVVHQGDMVDESVHRVPVVEDLKEEKTMMDLSTRTLGSYPRIIDRTPYTMTPATITELSSLEETSPFTKREINSFGTISLHPDEINPAHNLLRTDFGKLGKYLSSQFNEHRPALARLGIKNNIKNLSPGEAIKFTQYLMRLKLKSRASGDPKERASDFLSIDQIYQGNKPLVCRNSAQVFEGSMKALKGLSNGSLDAMQVSTLSAAYYKTQAGSYGQPNDHAWNVVYTKGKEGRIFTTVVDEFQTAAGKKGDRTFERSLFTELNDVSDPQELVDNLTFNVVDFINQIKDKGIEVNSDNAWNTFQQKYLSLLNLEDVDMSYLNQQLDNLRDVLKEHDYKFCLGTLAVRRSVRHSMEIYNSKEPLFLYSDTWKQELRDVRIGMSQLLYYHRMIVETPEGAQGILANLNISKPKIKAVIGGLWKHLSSVDPKLFGDNPDYRYLYRKFSLIPGLPKAKVKYTSRPLKADK